MSSYSCGGKVRESIRCTILVLETLIESRGSLKIHERSDPRVPREAPLDTFRAVSFADITHSVGH
jgi:hypothetical protein